MGVRNFIDRVFTVISDLILKLLPASKQEKQAFAYYKAGMAAQAEGDYAEARVASRGCCWEVPARQPARWPP